MATDWGNVDGAVDLTHNDATTEDYEHDAPPPPDTPIIQSFVAVHADQLF